MERVREREGAEESEIKQTVNWSSLFCHVLDLLWVCLLWVHLFLDLIQVHPPPPPPFCFQGLYPESHGIVDNNMFDFNISSKKFKISSDIKNDPRWWGGEPVSHAWLNVGLLTGHWVIQLAIKSHIKTWKIQLVWEKGPRLWKPKPWICTGGEGWGVGWRESTEKDFMEIKKGGGGNKY